MHHLYFKARWNAERLGRRRTEALAMSPRLAKGTSGQKGSHR